MKIVFLNNDFRVYWKGRLYFLKSFFEHYGVDIHVVEIFGEGSPYAFDTPNNKESWWSCLFRNEGLKNLSKPTVRNKIFEKLDVLNPDIIVCGSIVFMSGAIGLQWAKKRQKKIILFDDARHSLYKRSMLTTFFKMFLTIQADAFLVPSVDYIKEYDNWGVDKKKLYYGLSCTNNKFFKKKSRIGNVAARNNIVCVARLVPVKNLQGLLNAWRAVEDKNKTYHLIIVGGGPEHVRLKEMVAALKLERVKILGPLNHRVIARLFSCCEALILPSFSESWGMVVNEAMAAGLPAILSNRVNSGSALLKEGFNGLLFDPYNVESISNTILEYIAFPEDTKKLMSIRSSGVIKRFSYHFLACELLRAFSDLSKTPNKKENYFLLKGINLWSGKMYSKGMDVLK